MVVYTQIPWVRQQMGVCNAIDTNPGALGRRGMRVAYRSMRRCGVDPIDARYHITFLLAARTTVAARPLEVAS